MAKVKVNGKTIDTSKRPKGMSAREYVAQQTGGKLDYKSGSISTPKTTTPTKSTPKPLVGEGPLLPGQTRASEFAGPSLPGQTKDGYYNWETNSTKTTGGTTAKPSNRATASKGSGSSKVAKVLGVSTANASGGEVRGGTITQGKSKGIFERLLEIGKDPFGLEPKTRGLMEDRPWEGGYKNLLSYKASPIYQKEAGAGDAISQLLNGVSPNMNPSRTDDIVSQNFEPYRPEPRDSREVINQGYGPINYQNEKSSKKDTRTSSPVSRPNTNFTPAYSPINLSSLSSLSTPSFRSPQSTPDYSGMKSDDGTVRRLAGQGHFSKGQYGNGQGDYGMSGNFGNAGMDDESSILRDLLGINTASANGERQLTADDMVNLGAMNEEENAMLRTGGFSTPNIMQNQPRQTYTGGGQTNYTGGSSPVQAQLQGKMSYFDQQRKSEEKSYKAQEKAQKRALEELIKSIEGQYQTSETEGRQALDQSKQQDALKLSGLFSFANQDPNSEQRIQYQNRMSDDYAGRLTDLLSKLGQGRSQDISGAKQNFQNQVGSLAERRNQAMRQIQESRMNAEMQMAQLMEQIQARQESSRAKASPKPSRTGTYTIVPGQGGQNQYMYVDNYGQYQPITESQYMAGKYGVGIGNYGGSNQNDLSGMSDEELQAMLYGGQ
jgi:hypothetical protein